ncbi:site-specific DNA-methyltransferase [Microbulbifer sp. ALW1]|uniref:site-specific DNA-methyltransferase n=1 Tax=Microbulbifer sp. (strain ALW1) TaxID=1516059 RepID=UPI001911FB66|nr:DNA methyltransferase [Microbulbifer sp. ALW1]
MDKAIAGAQALEVDPDTLPKVQQLKAQLNDGFDLAREEGEVYDALVTFFNRYYDEGDFLSRRVYKNGTYAIPYQGEEVVLHWANKDQYYIKSSETLRDYSFRLNPNTSDIEPDPLRVHFKLVDAEAGAQNNNKESDSGKRVFILDAEQPFELIEGEPNEDGQQFPELQIRFVFRAATQDDWNSNAATQAELAKATAAAKKKPPVQGVLVASATAWLLSEEGGLPEQWRRLLAQPYTKANGEQADYSRLQGQLNNYTKKNSFDYFIHKDLGGFLNRELDFYIKNELLDWADLAALKNNPTRLAPLLSKIEVIRKLGESIIAFLAQLENFQKKLWLKKKFVTETNYCITLDRLAEHTALLEQVFANERQLQDWQQLYKLDLEQLKQDYAQQDWPEFLAQPKYRYLMLDTRHFDDVFKAQLLATIEDLDAQCDGLLVHSENFQALNLLQERYREQVKCIYIDPPYNTDASAIMYKNGYKSSTWASLIWDRLLRAKSFLRPAGVLAAAIDDEQKNELSFLMKEAFESDLLAVFCIRSNPSGRPTKTGYSVSHEYTLYSGKDASSFVRRLPPTKEQSARFNESDDLGRFEWRNLRREGSNSDRSARRALFYPIYIRNGEIHVPEMEWSEGKKEWIVLEDKKISDIVVWPVNDQGEEKTWRWESKKVTSSLSSLGVRKDRSGKDYIYYKRRPNEDGVVSVSSWFDAKYSSTEHGSAIIKDLFGGMVFSYPKSIHAVTDSIYISGAAERGATVLDYFSGSGTTGHSVINLNREDHGKRKYLLVEMGDYFDTVLKPRIQKVAYAENWKVGAPVADSEGGFNGMSHCFKYVRLESYEDSLGNLALHRGKGQQELLQAHENSELDAARQSYVMNYLLEVETRGSRSLLNTKLFTDPTAYQLDVRSASGDETKAVNVDLLETFNYLLGLTVEHIAAPVWFDAELSQGEFGRWQAQVSRVGAEALASKSEEKRKQLWWFRTVYGTNRAGQKVLVVWRNLPSVIAEKDKGLLLDNAVLDAVLIEKLNIRLTQSSDDEVDILYVNGDHNIAIPKNRRGEPMEEARVQLIEEAFHRLMFAGTEAAEH